MGTSTSSIITPPVQSPEHAPGVTDVTDVLDVTDIPGVTDVTGVTDVPGVTDEAFRQIESPRHAPSTSTDA